MCYYNNVLYDYNYSDSVFGAVFGTLQFFYNHSEVSYYLLHLMSY